MRRFFSSSMLLVALSTSALPSRASEGPAPYPACDREPSESDVAAAKGAYQAGQVSFHEADYARAILYWEDAFRRDCTADKLLINLARAYESADKLERAVLALETYLERRPDAEDRSSIEKRIANLRRELQREPEAADTSAPTESTPTTQGETDDATVPPPSDESADEPSKPKPLWPVIVTGSGVVLGGVGLGLYLAGDSTLSSVTCGEAVDGRRACLPNSEEGTTAFEERQRAEDAQAQRNLGGGLAIGGAVVAVGGAVLWTVLWSKSGEDEETSLSPSRMTPIVTPTFAGLSYRGSF